MCLRSISSIAVWASLSVVACTAEQDSPTVAQEHVRVLPATLPRLPSTTLPHLAHRSATLQGHPLVQHGSNAAIAGPRRIAMKTLLIGATGAEPSFLAAQDSLDRIGAPYQALIASQQPLTADMLTDDISTCYFNSVIFATSGLGYTDATGAWVSALSTAQWQMLADFETACSAREAIWYAWPSTDLGLNPPTTVYQWTDALDAHVADSTFFASVPATASIPITDATAYGSSIADAATTALLVDGGGNVLLAHHTYSDGREALIATFDQSPYLTHTLALEYDMIRWVTQGMFVGKKRAYLTPQVDDVFIDDDLWVPGVGDDGTVIARITGTDIDALASWQAGFAATLPTGSTYRSVFAFNGVGTRRSSYTDQTIWPEAAAAGPAFLWMSHTWNHDNMDAMTQAQATSECTRNISLATQRGFNAFSTTELVTPDVSGLQNLAALHGMYAAGVRYVVSDTSVTAALQPTNPGTNPSFNVGNANPFFGSIYQVPRHPTNFFYNVTTPAAETDEYNAIYRAYFGFDLTYDQVLDTDSEFGKFYLLRGDIDPLMFHQTNLTNYGGGRSLYADWVSMSAEKFLAVSAEPIQTLQHRDIAAAMQARGALDACGLTATIVESATGRSLELASTGACVVPVTGLSAPTSGPVETYLGAPTTSIAMAAGSTQTIALP